MAKKADLRQAAQTGAKSVFETIATGDTQDTKDTRNTTDTEDTATAYYRFNLKMPAEYQVYLRRAAYKASTPDHQVSITEYLNKIIADDIERNGGGIE